MNKEYDSQRDSFVDAVDFAGIYYLLLRNLWLIGLITFFVCFCTWIWLAQQPKLYTATTVVRVEQNEQQVLDMKEVSEDDPSSKDFISTVIAAIPSRPVMTRVVEALNLTADKTFGPLKANGKSYTVQQLADYLRSRTEVESRTGTRLIDVSVDDTDPERAQKLAFAIVKEFFRESFSQRLAVSRVANGFLLDEASRLREKLVASERELQDYKEKHQAISLEDKQNIISEKLKDINGRVTEAKAVRLRLEADLEQVKKIDPTKTDDLMRVPSVSELPEVASIRDDIVKAETELAGIQERYLEKHPKHVSATTKITAYKNSLRTAVANAGAILARQYESAIQNEQKLEASLKDQESLALELSSIAIPYAGLKREVESDRAVYESIIKRAQETAVMKGVEQVPFQIVEEPLVPSRPSKPKIPFILAVTAFVTAALVAGIIVVSDILSSSFKTVDMAETYLDLPALAAVPVLISAKKRMIDAAKSAIKERKVSAYQKALRQADAVGHPLVMVTAPSSPAAEAIRTLRASISLLGKEDTRRTILFTSAIPAEGKSFTTVNYAIALAQQGLKTVVLDCDLRRPTLHGDFMPGIKGLAGLSDYFSGEAEIDKILHPTDVGNLVLLPAGSRCPNPSELLAKSDFSALIDALLKRYDRVVVDTAPINAVSDTLTLARWVDQVVVVVRIDRTPRKAVLRAVRQLREAEANVAGIVLNRLSTGVGAGYYYYYYGNRYQEDSVYGTPTA